MEAYKKILIGLDLTGTDKRLIEYAALLSEKIQPEKIYFIHVARNLELPAGVEHEYPELSKVPADEAFVEKVRQNVNKHFNNWKDISHEFHVVEGDPVTQLLHWSSVKKAGLMIIGRKTGDDGNVPARLARKTACDILFVPEKTRNYIRHIGVPVDFSEHSALALERAGEIASLFDKARIYGEHVYNVPWGFTETGKTYEEFSGMMKALIEKDFYKFTDPISKKGHSIEPVFTLDRHSDPSKAIYRTARKEKADLLVMGSRGRTDSAALLLGSVTERVIRLNTDIPLLVVRKPGENIRVLDVLLKKGR